MRQAGTGHSGFTGALLAAAARLLSPRRHELLGTARISRRVDQWRVDTRTVVAQPAERNAGDFAAVLWNRSHRIPPADRYARRGDAGDQGVSHAKSRGYVQPPALRAVRLCADAVLCIPIEGDESRAVAAAIPPPGDRRRLRRVAGTGAAPRTGCPDQQRIRDGRPSPVAPGAHGRGERV